MDKAEVKLADLLSRINEQISALEGHQQEIKSFVAGIKQFPAIEKQPTDGAKNEKGNTFIETLVDMSCRLSNLMDKNYNILEHCKSI